MEIRMCVWALAATVLLQTAAGQDMQPRVTITETDPPSDGARVRGTLAKYAWFNCYVENLQDLMVRWVMTKFTSTGPVTVPISDDMDVKDNMKWSIEKPTQFSWRLRVRAIQQQDQGNYTCFVILTTNNNRVQANRTLLVTDPPLILEEHSSTDVEVKEDDFLPLRCNASGLPAPTIMWRREGNAILPGGGVRRMGSKLDITGIQYDARGRYICEAFNEVGTDRRDIIVTVQHSPKMFPENVETLQAVGFQRTLICFVDASPAPSTDPEMNQLYWSRGSQRIRPDNRMMVRVMEGAYGRLTFELIITHVQQDDYGSYRCHARNNIGDGVADLKLIETSEPQIDKQGEISGVTSQSISMATVVMAICLFLLHKL